MGQPLLTEDVIVRVVGGSRFRLLTMEEVVWLHEVTERFSLPGCFGVQLHIVRFEDGNLWIKDNELH